MMSGKNLAKYVNTRIRLHGGVVDIYASPKIATALKELTDSMDLYHGVRFFDVLEAAYEQGLKNGRRDVIEQIDEMKKTIKYLPPGRPKKNSKKKSK